MQAGRTVLLVSLCALALARLLSGGELTKAVRSARLTGGVILLVNASSAIYDEAAATGCTVRGLENAPAAVDALRKRYLASGVYGKLSVAGFDNRSVFRLHAVGVRFPIPHSTRNHNKVDTSAYFGCHSTCGA